jgi:hypothetical protein
LGRVNKVDVEDAQLPSCQIAMIVLASSGPEAAAALGINSWWNQEAPGKNQAKMAGDMVETA